MMASYRHLPFSQSPARELAGRRCTGGELRELQEHKGLLLELELVLALALELVLPPVRE